VCAKKVPAVWDDDDDEPSTSGLLSKGKRMPTLNLETPAGCEKSLRVIAQQIYKGKLAANRGDAVCRAIDKLVLLQVTVDLERRCEEMAARLDALDIPAATGQGLDLGKRRDDMHSVDRWEADNPALSKSINAYFSEYGFEHPDDIELEAGRTRQAFIDADSGSSGEFATGEPKTTPAGLPTKNADLPGERGGDRTYPLPEPPEERKSTLEEDLREANRI